MDFDLQHGRWINPPSQFQIGPDTVELVTDPGTDFWQATYYGFRNDNAPALLFDSQDNFTFTVKTTFDYQTQFDQCGVIVYLDSQNWCKISLEYETPDFSRLGSVVTNIGYSDWATVDILSADRPGVRSLWYRLSRRGPDFLVESAFEGEPFSQMRIFHMHRLGETTAAMGQQDPPLPPKSPAAFGVYACSPLDASFRAVFSDFRLEPCRWKAHHSE